MRVVVTGATGNVGTALLRLLRGPDWHVTGLARRVPPPRGAYAAAEWVACDLSSAAPPDEVLRDADAVVHLAWAINPSSADPPMEATNVGGTRRVLDAVVRAGVPRLVCGSSIAAYRPAPRWQRVSETWPVDGVRGSAYSRGKAELERTLDAFAEHYPQVRVTRLRPCGILQRDAAGQIGRWLLSPLIPAEMLSMPRFPLPLWRELRLQLVHADDVAEAIRLALLTEFDGPVNLAAEPVLRPDDLAQLFGATHVPAPRQVLSGVTRALWRIGVHPLHPGWLELADQAPLVDTTRARETLGWQPAHDTREVLTAFAGGLRGRAGTASEALAPRARGVWQRLAATPPGRPSHQSQD